MRYKVLHFLIAALLLAFALCSRAQVVPRPAQFSPGSGTCRLDGRLRLHAGYGVRPSTIRYLQHYWLTFYRTPLKTGATKIILELDAKASREAYQLKIDSSDVTITGSQAGIFYGIQTLLQLLPVDRAATKVLPCGTISDEPRYAYRGMHLDVSRHFFPAAYIKRYLDLLALHKINIFHWHLTDNEGWRLPIKAYPKLAAGEHYSAAEIKDIVRYAADRFITIIPEIDLPGHNQAALKAYPQFAAAPSDTANAFRPDTASLHFFQKVLDEVCKLFPGPYIHLGGDEVDFQQWRFDKPKNVENEFIGKLAQYLKDKGRKTIGWDELMEAPLDSTVTIMGWRLSGFAAQAAKKGHSVIQAPYDYTYFDFAQHQREDSVTVKMYLPLSKVYQFKLLNNPRVMGGEACLWTENIGNIPKLEYMLLPRLAALSEALWSAPEKRDWTDFIGRMTGLEAHYRLWGYNYCKTYE